MSSNKKLTIQHAQEVAKNKNGKCLSIKYINIDTKLTWVCEFGHQWEASLYSVKNIGSWCHHCTGFAKLTIDEMKLLAASKRGRCVSTTYMNSDTKLTWECEFGHQWQAIPNAVKNHNSWCPECAGKKKLTIDTINGLAKYRGGRCLSLSYKNNRSKLKWECEFGHQWEANSSSVRSGTWCPECSGNIKLTLSDMQEIAKIRGGKCSSKQYANAKTKLQWECSQGHTWTALPGDIRNGKWCPTCYKSRRKGENAVRSFFEEIFKNKFPSVRPLWLTYEGGRLELDGYCEDLKIAFEYQGLYHSDESAYWYPDKSTSFERRQLLDNYKRIKCAESDVLLIEIPELNPRNKPEKWKDDIKDILISNGIIIPDHYDEISFGALEYHTSNNYTDQAHEVAKLRRGICHSKNIIYRNQIVEWECELAHTWSATLSQIILKSTWCPECAGRKKLTITQVQELAKTRGGKCLSTEYKNAHTKLEWECSQGHRWFATPSSIKNNNTWCLQCSGSDKLVIEQMQVLAKAQGGRCLSTQYVNSKTKLEWECAQGHRWFATSSCVKSRGAWCHKCGGSEKLTIEQMQELAKTRGGKCLSTEYRNARTKLEWECSQGHRWFAVPDKIKNIGRWCRQCKQGTNVLL